MPKKKTAKANEKDHALRTSYSKIVTYEQCPRKYYYSYVLKLPRKEKDWSRDRGVIIHKKGENFLLGKIKGVPDEFKLYEAELKNLKRYKAIPEEDMSFTREWQSCAWNDWDSVWNISRVDAGLESDDTAHIIDYKTGKVYDTHKDQSDIYTLSAFVKYPNVEFVSTEFWYLDQPNEDPGCWEYERDKHFEYLKRMFIKRTNKIKNEKSWKCKPSFKCAWCDYSKKEGGPCEN